MKKKKTILIALAIMAATGCAGMQEAYNRQVWTPDGLNYTLSRDRASGELCDYVGFTWNLKPEKK